MAYNTRSISLPTRSNPINLSVEEQLCRLRSSELATSSSSISSNLDSLKELYESVNDLIQLQPTQYEDCIDTVLDRSLMLLDVCSTTKDVLTQVKQSVQDLQSSIRRRGDLNMANEYMTSRKMIVKMIRKCLKGLKKLQNQNEVDATTLAAFESVLSFLSKSKQSNRSFISKLMGNKRVSCNEEINEVEKVDLALNAQDVKNAQNSLVALEMIIQDLEERLESVYRCLIKNRVSLLNIN